MNLPRLEIMPTELQLRILERLKAMSRPMGNATCNHEVGFIQFEDGTRKPFSVATLPELAMECSETKLAFLTQYCANCGERLGLRYITWIEEYLDGNTSPPA